MKTIVQTIVNHFFNMYRTHYWLDIFNAWFQKLYNNFRSLMIITYLIQNYILLLVYVFIWTVMASWLDLLIFIDSIPNNQSYRAKKRALKPTNLVNQVTYLLYHIVNDSIPCRGMVLYSETFVQMLGGWRMAMWCWKNE